MATSQDTSELRVLIQSKFLGDFLLRQTPGQKGVWSRCKFTINADQGEFDRVVVYDTIETPIRVTCPPDGTLMLVGEPPEIKQYHPAYLAQFTRIASPDTNTPHPRLIDTQCGQPWFVGVALEHGQPPRAVMDFDDLKRQAPTKTKTLSVMAALRNLTEGHKARAGLVDALQRRLGDDVTVFSHYTNRVDDKWDALAPFKYHVSLENSRYPNYWTEKLSDSYLADCFTFYWGCPNADDYFDPRGFRPINIYDPEATAETIARGIEDGLYETTTAIRADDRNKVLDTYNIFALLERLLVEPTQQAPRPLNIMPERNFTDSKFRKIRNDLKRAVPRSLRPKRWKV